MRSSKSVGIVHPGGPTRGGFEQRAAEDGAAVPRLPPSTQQRDDGVASIVVARVAARGRDPAREEEASVPIIEDDLPGHGCAESCGFDAVIVSHDLHAGN